MYQASVVRGRKGPACVEGPNRDILRDRYCVADELQPVNVESLRHQRSRRLRSRSTGEEQEIARFDVIDTDITARDQLRLRRVERSDEYSRLVPAREVHEMMPIGEKVRPMTLSIRLISTRAVASPPAEETRYSWRPASAEKTIDPARFHVPPLGWTASHSICTGPPVAATLLSVPRAKKPRKRLSGDQNGLDAPSVSANCNAVVESSR